MGVGAAGGATKATVANVLKAKGHAHQSAVARASWTKVRQQVNRPQKRTGFNRCGQIFPGGGMLCEKQLQKIGFRRALLLIKPAHTGHHPGAVPGFRPSPGNSEETTTRVLTEEISVLFRVPTWDPTHPGSPVSRALPGNTPTQGPTRESEPGFFLGGGGNPGITQVRT